ncbi:MAG: hypothetical protein DHS20C16_35780 [Phycisphaerae bacterium]|nr:MAG: hypothetical protein DHS20C16_35780 [Phycisphaerae bacterium]
MLLKRTYSLLLFAIVLTLTFGMFSVEAGAQPDGQAGNDMMAKKGMSGLFAGKLGNDDPRAPTPVQKWIGIGSLGVMVIVIKYL